MPILKINQSKKKIKLRDSLMYVYSTEFKLNWPSTFGAVTNGCVDEHVESCRWFSKCT